jgi:hypothetical protein
MVRSHGDSSREPCGTTSGASRSGRREAPWQLRRGNPHAASLPRRFIRCHQWASAIFDRYAEKARRSEGWSIHELAASHLPFITHPHELTALLLEIAA